MIKGIHHISMKCGTAEELTNVRKFYIDILGLKIIREWAEGMMIDTGNGLLEIFPTPIGPFKIITFMAFFSSLK